MKKIKEIVHELRHHGPFTAFATVIAILIALFLTKYGINVAEESFEIFHPLHVIASAIVTSAMFYKFKKNVIKGILVGVSGAIIIGSLSDVILPFLGGLIFALKPSFHLPIIEEPLMILGAAFLGAAIGIISGFTRVPHFIHVFLSIFASMFYLLAYSTTLGFFGLAATLLIVFIAVLIPCCMSDIIFPFLFIGEKIKHCSCQQ